jgi:hypothetical protein
MQLRNDFLQQECFSAVPVQYFEVSKEPKATYLALWIEARICKSISLC